MCHSRRAGASAESEAIRCHVARIAIRKFARSRRVATVNAALSVSGTVWSDERLVRTLVNLFIDEVAQQVILRLEQHDRVVCAAEQAAAGHLPFVVLNGQVPTTVGCDREQRATA